MAFTGGRTLAPISRSGLLNNVRFADGRHGAFEHRLNPRRGLKGKNVLVECHQLAREFDAVDQKHPNDLLFTR
jgi:hypothetical protein